MKQLYCPWREKYSNDTSKIRQPDATETECVFCKQFKENNDAQNFILKRYKHNVIILNKFPYNAGHLMVIPLTHTSDIDQLSPEERAELIELTSRASTILRETLHAQGMNIGMNLGTRGGAGIPSHIHMHVIPRYDRDTNFLATVSGTKAISHDLHEIYEKLRPLFN